MQDLSQVGSFILNMFLSLWDFMLNDMGWIGVAVLGFVVIRLIIFAMSFLLSHHDKNS